VPPGGAWLSTLVFSISVTGLLEVETKY
jgi:hypothetical protein